MKTKAPADNFFVYFDLPENNPAAEAFPPGSSLYVTTVGKATTGPGEPYPYRKEEHPAKYTLDLEQGRTLDEFQFIYISAGSGRLHSFEGDSSVRHGSLIVIVPGEKHRYAPDPATGWTEYWIGFSGTAPREWISRGLLEKGVTVYPILNQTALSAPFEEALEFARRQPYALQGFAASCVMRIFACLAEDRHLRLNHIDHDVIEKAKKIFEEHVYHPLDIEELIRSLNINYQNLRDQFREKNGISPYQYFLQLKINKAKELLREGTLSIKEISYKLSFNSPYYFSRLFKRKTGLSPSQWNNTTSPADLDLWE